MRCYGKRRRRASDHGGARRDDARALRQDRPALRPGRVLQLHGQRRWRRPAAGVVPGHRGRDRPRDPAGWSSARPSAAPWPRPASRSRRRASSSRTTHGADWSRASASAPTPATRCWRRTGCSARCPSPAGRSDAFDPDELEFLRTICRYVTVAYERLRLVRRSCARPTARRTTSSRCWPTSCATRWPRSATACR